MLTIKFRKLGLMEEISRGANDIRGRIVGEDQHLKKIEVK